MSESRHIAEIVDELLAAPKYLPDQGHWRQGTSDETRRLVYPVLLEDGTRQCELAATARLWSQTAWFSISLIFKRECIVRLDMDPDVRTHVNPFQTGNHLSGLTIEGPHYHAWEDNKHLATHASLPKQLLWRRPHERQSWEVAFRWFVTEVNIDQPQTFMIPAYPERKVLL